VSQSRAISLGDAILGDVNTSMDAVALASSPPCLSDNLVQDSTK
jgi:hypothetical protein